MYVPLAKEGNRRQAEGDSASHLPESLRPPLNPSGTACHLPLAREANREANREEKIASAAKFAGLFGVEKSEIGKSSRISTSFSE